MPATLQARRRMSARLPSGGKQRWSGGAPQIDWAHFWTQPPAGKWLSDYQYLILLPVAGAAMADLAGQLNPEPTLCSRVMDAVFRFLYLNSATMQNYAGEPDKPDAAAQAAQAMAQNLGFQNGTIKREFDKLVPSWLQLIQSTKM